MGRRGEYGTIDVIARLAKINQQVYNRLVARFYADHDVYGYDPYAWALYEARAALAEIA